MLRSLCAFLGVTLLCPTTIVGQANSMKQLADKMPPGANAVMIVNVDAIKKSDIAQKEKWFELQSANLESGMGFLPAGTNGVFFATQLDFQMFEPMWTSGFLTMDVTPPLSQIAERLWGHTDKVAGKEVVSTHSDVYVFELNKNTLGTFSPAKRQRLSVWLSAIESGQASSMTDYLKEAAADAAAGTPFVLAIDLDDAVSPGAVLKRARDAAILQKEGIDANAFAELLASVRGATITARFSSKIEAKAEIDFDGNASIIRPIAKQLVIEMLDNNGSAMPELEQWNSNVSEHQVTMVGDLSKKSLRRLISIFDSPETHLATGDSPSTSSSDDAGMATKRYMDSIALLLNELRDEIGVGGQSMWKYQRWMKSVADKIDNLPMRNVDSDALDFGASVSQTFQDISMKITNVHEHTDIKNADLMAYGVGAPNRRTRRYGWGYSGWGYGWATPWRYNYSQEEVIRRDQTEAEKRAIHTKARAETTDFGSQAFNDAVSRERVVRREMSERYPDAFSR